MNLNQEVDGIIAEEKLDVPQEGEESKEVVSDEQDSQNDNTDSKSGDSENEGEEASKSGEDDASEDEESKKSDEDEEEPEEVGKQVEEAKSFIKQLTEGGLEVLDDKGNPKDFREVLPPAKYFLSQLDPIKVTDKDGKTHEFLLLKDVEDKFPDGFEAKNNIEQLKFERAIARNEDKFDKAIADYNHAEEVYKQEVGQVTQALQRDTSLANEYKAMAAEGLVPEIGDPKDPNFKDSDAVKELDKILTWMDGKNAELKKKGLGEINSLYIAKQLMDKEAEGGDKEQKKQKIDKQRKEVASLSNAPSGSKDKEAPKKTPTNVPMSNYIEQLIAEEGLK